MLTSLHPPVPCRGRGPARRSSLSAPSSPRTPGRPPCFAVRWRPRAPWRLLCHLVLWHGPGPLPSWGGSSEVPVCPCLARSCDGKPGTGVAPRPSEEPTAEEPQGQPARRDAFQTVPAQRHGDIGAGGRQQPLLCVLRSFVQLVTPGHSSRSGWSGLRAPQEAWCAPHSQHPHPPLPRSQGPVCCHVPVAGGRAAASPARMRTPRSPPGPVPGGARQDLTGPFLGRRAHEGKASWPGRRAAGRPAAALSLRCPPAVAVGAPRCAVRRPSPPGQSGQGGGRRLGPGHPSPGSSPSRPSQSLWPGLRF